MIDLTQKTLAGKKGRNLGVANQHSISPGPAKARTGFGTRRIDNEPELADHRAATRQFACVEFAAGVLAVDYARLLTGETVYVDGRYHFIG
jgi:enoyl-[acyl-carrier protein] reductase I